MRRVLAVDPVQSRLARNGACFVPTPCMTVMDKSGNETAQKEEMTTSVRFCRSQSKPLQLATKR